MIFRFPESIVLSVSGPHATRYLTARLTNDIRFNVGQSCLAAILTPQGKTEGIFLVIKTSADSYLLISDSGNRSEIVSALKRYIVADRLEVTDLSESYELIHLYGAHPQFSNLTKAYDCRSEGNTWIVARNRSKELGLDVIKPKAASFSFPNSQELSELDFNIKRVEAGIVAFVPEMRERLFLEAGSVEAISSTKGCYTGQEVVERILSHGRSPKLLRAVKFQSKAVTPGEKVYKENAIVGEVVSVYFREPSFVVGFISIRNDESIRVRDLRVGQTPLIDL